MHKTKERVELHLHTAFSTMDALTRVDKAVKKAAEYGHPAIAITDYGNVQAFPEAHRAGQKYGMKVIYGIECDCKNDAKPEDSSNTFRVILLIKNDIGRRNLYKLMSHYQNQKLSITRSLLEEHREGLLVGTVGYKGELFKAIMKSDCCGSAIDRNLIKIANFYDYIEILPMLDNMVISGCSIDRQTQQGCNVNMVRIAKTANKPFVAAGNVHFLEAEDEICKKILLSTKGIDAHNADISLHFKTTSEMLHEFSYLGEADAFAAVVHNTRSVADSVDDDINPFFECAYYPYLSWSEEKVRNACMTRAKEIYGLSLPKAVQMQLDWELTAIEAHGFSALYTIAEKLVKRSKDTGYSVGTRGCISASLAAYLMGITDINPLSPHYVCPNCRRSIFSVSEKYDNGFDMPDAFCSECGTRMKKDGFNLSVETVLGLRGDMVPDIDLNFSGEYQALAVRHLKELFGKERVFRAGMIQTLSERLALAYTERYSKDHDLNLNEDELVGIAGKIYGVKWGDDQHPGGYFIAPQNTDVTEYSPVYKDGDNYVTHFSSLEISGYLEKIDLLGHDVPTLIRELQLVTGVAPSDISLDDKETLMLLVSGDTIGIPEFQNRFMRRMIEKSKPSCLADLIKLSGLSHGTGTWKENAEDLIESGTVSLSEVIALRDDVMQFLMKKGIDRTDAYKYMKLVITGRIGTRRNIEDWEYVFKSYGIDDWYIKSARKIKYLFPKAHAATYTALSFRIAWYKTHYPNHFYTVMLNHLDEAGTFTVSDFEKSPYDIAKELHALSEQAHDDYYWSDDYHNKRICALELLNDAYEHGHSFVPFYEYENKTISRSFLTGTNNSIRTVYLNRIY